MPPLDILKFCNDFPDKDTREGTSLECMKAFLESCGCTLRKFERDDVCNRRDEMNNALFNDHVILSARHVAVNTASWFVNWGSFEFHNCTEQYVSSMSFLNRPPTEKEGVYIVYHPQWSFDKVEFDRYYKASLCKGVSPQEMIVRANESIQASNMVIDNLVRIAILLENKAKLLDIDVSKDITVVKDSMLNLKSNAVTQEIEMPEYVEVLE